MAGQTLLPSIALLPPEPLPSGSMGKVMDPFHRTPVKQKESFFQPCPALSSGGKPRAELPKAQPQQGGTDRALSSWDSHVWEYPGQALLSFALRVRKVQLPSTLTGTQWDVLDVSARACGFDKNGVF